MKTRLLGSVLALSTTVLVLGACGSKRGGNFDDPAASKDGGIGGTADIGKCQGGKLCVGLEIHACSDDNKPGAKLGECNAVGEVCFNGECKSGCEATKVVTSNLGCEFWAVDLDNNKDGFNDAAGAPWGLVLANGGNAPAEVTIDQNDADPGAPQKITTWKKIAVAPNALQVLEMPTREVDGSLAGNNEGPGTMLSSRAFRVTSTAPIVVYQFNALRSQYSNDASLLLPTPALGSTYRALSWPSGQPVSFTIGGITTPIDRGYITILGTQEKTTVSVNVSQAVLGGGGIPATQKGGVVTATLGPFDVLNLETDGMPGDMTGTIVTSSAPVAVFVGTELSGGITNPTPPQQPGQEGKSCCLDHVEEQLLPVESYGKKFLIPRSPPRGKGANVEPDYIRFMGVAVNVDVKTNLPAPNDKFTLAPGQTRDILTKTDFVVEANEPIAIGQVLVSMEYTEDFIGDPSLTTFPAVDQLRQDYLFLVPGSWKKNHVVIAMPQGATVKIDGAAIACDGANIGTLDGVTYVSKRCPIAEGVHNVTGDKPFLVAAYGYGQAGSYAFVGGSNVKKIYVPPPLPPLK